MPAESPPNGAQVAEASSGPAVGNPDRSITQGDQDSAARAETSEPPGALSMAERLGAERDERRHQRMLVREASTATRDSPVRDSDRAAPHQGANGSASRLTPPGRQTLRESLTITLVATVVAGGVLGAILGALSVAGWVIGLLVAVLIVVLSAVLPKYPRST